MTEAQPKVPCCPKDSEPKLVTDYKPKGTTIDVNGLPMYTIGEGQKTIIVCPDIFGVDSVRTKEICDKLSEQGYLVVLPDFFRGDPWKQEKQFSGFFGFFNIVRRAMRNPWKKLSEDFDKCIYPYLEQKGVTKIGMMGFCWGAYPVLMA